jgi:hypothetical protein
MRSAKRGYLENISVKVEISRSNLILGTVVGRRQGPVAPSKALS